ncbi:MAG: hypothetical protein KA383_11960 [Phycisphaerae bacterium]|nr:hypothetical protein [Phycisphaerae bacterium]
MRQTWRIWGLIGWLLISTAARADEPTTAPAAYESASAVVRITSMHGSMQTNPDLVQALLSSTAVMQAAARDIKGLAPGWERSYDVRVLSAGPSLIEGDRASSALNIQIRACHEGRATRTECAQQVQQLLVGLTRELQRAMQDAGGREAQRLNDAVAASEQASAEAQQRLKDLQARQQELLEAAGCGDLNRERLAEEQTELEIRLRDLDLRLVSQRARQTALGEQIARLGREIGENVETNAAVTELTKVAQLRESALARIREQHEAGRVAQQEVLEQEELLARARAELAQQRQAAAQAAGGALVADLNRSLLQQSVDLAETEAERGAVAQLLAEMRERKLLDLADQYERDVRMILPTARAAVEDAGRQLLRAVNDRNRYQPPQVVVLGQGQ